MEGIKRLKAKPDYNEKAVLIIFSLYSPFVFDLDNVEIKYIIDAMRYSQLFVMTVVIMFHIWFGKKK